MIRVRALGALVGALSLLALSSLAFGEGATPRRWKIQRASQRGDLQRIVAGYGEIDRARRKLDTELQELLAEIHTDLAIGPEVVLERDPEAPFEFLLEKLPPAPRPSPAAPPPSAEPAPVTSR